MLCKHDTPRLFERSQGTVAASVGVWAQANDSTDQAMAMVADKLNANKPPPTGEKGKSSQGVNGGKDLEVDAKKEEAGFFGSFWNQKTGGKTKKVGAASMESVSRMGITFHQT